MTNWLSSNPFKANQEYITDLHELGLRMLNWHGGQGDPVYAVGSFYVDGRPYPDPEIVQDALDNLESDLSQQETMLSGEKVMVRRHGKMVSLRDFAGYTDETLRENVEDLSEIIDALQMAQRGELE